MELLGALEKKIEALVVLIKKLKSDNEQLVVENGVLKDQILQLQTSLLKKEESLKEWDAQKISAKEAVNALIKDINVLVEESR